MHAGLEYPAFYTRLYNLITAEAFAAKHRAQFFKLADLFLSSGLVPAYTIAAFAKKLARLAVSASPAGAMLAIAFIHNIIRRHPSCMVLLDSPSGGMAAGPSLIRSHASSSASFAWHLPRGFHNPSPLN
jgi:U3 small nucleolar RNA-associated protein 19